MNVQRNIALVRQKNDGSIGVVLTYCPTPAIELRERLDQETESVPLMILARESLR